MKQKRLDSLDLLRGLTIILMILVNSRGTRQYVLPPLDHTAWDGLSLADLVFPCFLFMMGITTYLSTRKFNFAFSPTLGKKMLRRTVLLFAFGLLVNWGSDRFPSLDQLRIMGVLQRFAICYLVVTTLAVTISHRFIPTIIGVLLVGYALLLGLTGSYVDSPDSITAIVDHAILGQEHILGNYNTDPEGFLSTIPSIAHTLLGFCAGRIILSKQALADRIMSLTLMASLLLFTGYLLQDVCPINKKLWTSTFTLVSCGYSLLALVVLTIVVDVRQWRFPRMPFIEFGVNPLVCYLLGEALIIVFKAIHIQGQSIRQIVYGMLANVAGDNSFSSFLYAAIIVLMVWVCARLMYRRNIVVSL